jgi:hypothetical protein
VRSSSMLHASQRRHYHGELLERAQEKRASVGHTRKLVAVNRAAVLEQREMEACEVREKLRSLEGEREQTVLVSAIESRRSNQKAYEQRYVSSQKASDFDHSAYGQTLLRSRCLIPGGHADRGGKDEPRLLHGPGGGAGGGRPSRGGRRTPRSRSAPGSRGGSRSARGGKSPRRNNTNIGGGWTEFSLNTPMGASEARLMKERVHGERKPRSFAPPPSAAPAAEEDGVGTAATGASDGATDAVDAVEGNRQWEEQGEEQPPQDGGEAVEGGAPADPKIADVAANGAAVSPVEVS